MQVPKLEAAKLPRRPPVRLTLILVAVLFVLATAPGGLLPLSQDLVEKVLGLIALGVGTDTMRPSGVPWGAASVLKGTLGQVLGGASEPAPARPVEHTRVVDRRRVEAPGQAEPAE